MKELMATLRVNDEEMDVLKSKFRATTSKLNEEQSKNQVLITVNSQLQQKMTKVERQNRDLVSEN